MSFFSKFFVFLICLAVFAAACAWIMGGESQKNNTRISIDASPNNVFRYLVDDEKIKNWASDLVSAGPYKDDGGEDDVSETLDRVVIKDGKESIWQDSVIRFQRGEALSIQSRKGGLTKTSVFQLEENDLGGTDVLYRTVKIASGLEQFMFPFQVKDSNAQLAAEMKNLKKLIESEVEPGADDENEEEEDALVVVDSSTSDNEQTPMPVPDSVPANSDGPSVVDRVLGTVYSDSKPKDGERNFESLFGTGG